VSKRHVYIEVKDILPETAKLLSNRIVMVCEEQNLTPHHPSTPTVTQEFSQPPSSHPPLLRMTQGDA